MKALSLILLALVISACAGASPARPANGQPLPGVPSPSTATRLQADLVPSELIVGDNRFAVGLMDSNGQMIHDATVHFQYYDLSNPKTPALESEADAVRLETPDRLTTIFANERKFERAGNWGVVIQARLPDGSAGMASIGFQVLAESPTLKVGQKMPALDTPTAGQVNDNLKLLTSSIRPNPAFYRSSLAQAVQSGKPTLLLLSTPAYCTSRMCGPAYDTTGDLQKLYGDRINFVSVEVYTGLPNPAESNWQLNPVMQDLGLATEPWLFLVDKNGTVAYRVEGLFTADEVQKHISSILASK
jgi:hypothetical protein